MAEKLKIFFPIKKMVLRYFFANQKLVYKLSQVWFPAKNSQDSVRNQQEIKREEKEAVIGGSRWLKDKED